MTQLRCGMGHNGQGVLTQEKRECVFVAECKSHNLEKPHSAKPCCLPGNM